MRVFGLLLGLGLTLLPAAAVGMGNWAEFTYEEEGAWTLDLPGACGDRVLYAIAADPPAGDVLAAYTGYTVADYDEDVGTITLACEGADDLVIAFAELSEWLELDEEVCPPLLLQQQQAELVCSSNWCECSGKCSVCCPEGYLPRCICSGAGSCRCTPIAEPDENEPES